MTDLTTLLEYERLKNKQLSDKVSELIQAERKYRETRNQKLLPALWNLEKEVTLLINPNKATQSTLKWLEQ